MNKTKYSILLFWVLCTCATNLCSQVSCASKSPEATAAKLPQWITTEKIRAGYLYAENDTKYAALMRAHGLNTVIIKGLFVDEKGIKETLENYREWARACTKEKLHVFAAYNWQPSSKSSSYRRVIYSDGSSGIAPCPRDRGHWQEYLTYFGKVIAELSLEPDLQIDGIFLDCELYGPELGLKRHYGPHTCFCDNCFSSFLLARSYNGSQLPSVRYRDRKRWLDKNKLLDNYFRFLERDVELLAKQFEQELHAVNGGLMLGMYPQLHNWVLKSIARGFGTDSFPMIVFATDSYVGGGDRRIPDEPIEFYRKSRIYSIYAAGFLLGSYGHSGLRANLYGAAKKCNGYWLFRMPMLWGKFSKNERLAYGTEKEYWQSIAAANDDIVAFTNETDLLTDKMNMQQEWKLLRSDVLETEKRDYKLPKVNFRGKQDFLFYTDEHREVRFSLYFKRLSNYSDNLGYEITTPGGETILTKEVSKQGRTEIHFQSQSTGTHLLKVQSGRCMFRLESTNTPIAVLDSGGFYTIGHVEPLYFYVNDANKKVVILGNGSGSETFRIVLKSPAGKILTAETNPLKNNLRLEIEPPVLEAGIWSLSITKANRGRLEDVYFSLMGLRDTWLTFRPDWIFRQN